MKYYLVFICAFVSFYQINGQIELSPSFQILLQEADLDFIYPLEGKYKERRVSSVSAKYENYDYAIFSRKEKIEIRYAIRPFDQKDLSSVAPHVASMRIVTHLATNDINEIISGLSLDPEVVKKDFNADWGKVFIFQPKSRFAFYKQCKLLALHREGKGTAFIYFLFDEPSKELDNRLVSLRFRQFQENN